MSPKEAIEIRFIEKDQFLPVEEVASLYRDADWLEDSKDAIPSVRAMIAGSFCFAAAFYDGRLVGIGRAISDGISDAYIQDVTVRRSYRHRGIAHALTGSLVARLRDAGVDWIGLIASPGLAGIYEELGFRAMEGCVPMRFMSDDTAQHRPINGVG